MLRREAYRSSAQKRSVDLMFAGGLLLPSMFARAVAWGSFTPKGEKVLFEQSRLGKNYQEFMIKKIRTLGQDGLALSILADYFRRAGVDELPQVTQILNGQMCAVGRRPLTCSDIISEYDMVGDDREGSLLVDQHRRQVLPQTPGCLSTYVLQAHRGEVGRIGKEAASYRLESEIRDSDNASLKFDLSLIYQLGQSVLTRQMRSPDTGILPETDNAAL